MSRILARANALDWEQRKEQGAQPRQYKAVWIIERMRPYLPTEQVALAVTLWFSAAALENAHARGTQQGQLRWYKGNTHTHTLNSDGDTSPDEVARWYREHNYQFLVLSDHNYLTSVDGLNALMGADERFLLIPGEEVTDRFETKPIHINGLNVDTLNERVGGGLKPIAVDEALLDYMDPAKRVGFFNEWKSAIAR